MGHINGQLCRVPKAQRKSHIGKIYVITDDNKVETEVKAYIGRPSSNMFYLPYSVVCVSDLFQINDKALSNAAKSMDANVFTQVPTLDQDCPVFIFNKAANATLGIDVINLINEAEKHFNESSRAAIINFANNNPDACNDWLLSDIEDENLVHRHTAISYFSSLKGIISSSPTVTKRQLEMMNEFNEARKNFVKNVQALKNGELEDSKEAEKLVDWVLKDLTAKQKDKIVKLYLKELDNEGVEGFYSNLIDKEAIPHRSKIRLFIEKSPDCINNDGYYRLSYQFADSERKPLHFKHKSACIIYLMLLIYRKKEDNLNSFFTFEKDNIEDKNLFVKLMTSVYDKNDKEAGLDYCNLFTDEYGAQGRLKDYIKSCQDLFDEEVMDYESPYPFIPQKIGASGREFLLPILPQNITFDESFPINLSDL